MYLSFIEFIKAHFCSKKLNKYMYKTKYITVMYIYFVINIYSRNSPILRNTAEH